MTFLGQIYLTLPLANAAISAAAGTWSAPALVDVDGGRHVDWSQLAPQTLAAPMQLIALTYAVPSIAGFFAGVQIDIADLLSPSLP